ncbi:cellulose-binding protein [Actinosynnema sp. NPDC059797]
MTAVEGTADLVPLRTDFDVVWRGYDPRQVRHYVASTEADLRVLAVDRDAASARAEDLARQLENARAEITVLRRQLDEVCRTPIDPLALDVRLRRMAELAHEQAAEITDRAKAAADHHWATAERAAGRLRERYDRLVGELDARRRDLEAEHREVMRQAHERVAVMTREAELRRRELDERAAALREQVQADFEVAMNARRAEALADLARLRAAAEAEAARLVREAGARAEHVTAQAEAHAERVTAEAEAHAERVTTRAERRVEELRARREDIAESLKLAQDLLAAAAPLLDPLPEEVPAQRDELELVS